MGIRTDPGYRLYTGNSLCFPATKSPKKIYVNVSGIKQGAAWTSYEQPAQNGTFICESSDGVHWSNYDYPFDVLFVLLPTSSSLFLTAGGFPTMFYFYTTEQCVFCGENMNNNELGIYYGGSFIAVPRD